MLPQAPPCNGPYAALCQLVGGAAGARSDWRRKRHASPLTLSAAATELCLQALGRKGGDGVQAGGVVVVPGGSLHHVPLLKHLRDAPADQGIKRLGLLGRHTAHSQRAWETL